MHYKNPNEEVSIQKETRQRKKKKKKKLRMGGAVRATAAAVVVVILILSEGIRGGNATKHKVGGSQGWDVSTNLNSWASSHTFKVGDQLEFQYTAGLHSVVELGTESEYKSCNIGNPVNTMSDGKDVVKLSKVGTRYFVCGTSGHCAQGMKLKVNILAASAAANNTSSSPSSAPASTSSASASSASALQSNNVYLVPITLLVSITISLLIAANN